MYRKNPQYTTPIEELPELEDLESSMHSKNKVMNNPTVLPENKYTKFLRNSHVVPSESGMASQPNYEKQYFEKLNAVNYNLPSENESYSNEPVNVNHNLPNENEYSNKQENIAQFREKFEVTKPEISCIDIANHIEKCPLCSKFYNNDKTVYVIAIVLLSIICLLLLKKVLNV